MSASGINIAEVINHSRISRYQWQVFGVCWLIAFLDGIDLQAMPMAAPALRDAWGLSAAELGPVFTAGPVGMVLGALVMGPLADWFGRKWLIIAATAIFGLFTLLTPLVTSVEGLVVMRLLTGVGLGGVLPNLIALVSEYAPDRRRATATTLTFSSMPIGSSAGGLLGAWVIPAYGWESIFWIGGALPLLLALCLPVLLPESIRFLAARDRDADRSRIAGVMARIAPARDFASDARFTIPERKGVKPSVLDLFGAGRTAATATLLLVAMLNMVMLYFMISWLPTIMTEAGLSVQHAILSTVPVTLGGLLASFTIGPLVDRRGPFLVVGLTFVLAFFAVLSLGTGMPLPVLVPLLFLAGLGISGAQFGLYTMVALMYPTRLRGTGGGLVLGAGRLGSIVGPAAGGLAFALDLPVIAIFAVVAVPGLLAAALIWLLATLPRQFGQDDVASRRG